MSENPVTISPGGRAYFTEGVLAALELPGDHLADLARDVDDKKDMTAVATVSSRDEHIGDLLAQEPLDLPVARLPALVGSR